MKGKRLHIGCGKKYQKGWVNIDISPMVKSDLRLDVDEGLPFPDNSVAAIRMYHSLEHVKRYLFVIEELFRVCKDRAEIIIGVPYVTSSMYNKVNPYHVTHFNEYSFDFFDSTKLKGSAHEGTKAEFRVTSRKLNYFDEWKDKTQEEKDFARRHYWNVVKSIDFKLTVIKPICKRLQKEKKNEQRVQKEERIP